MRNGIPEVGDGATYNFGSDCYPATVIKLSASGKTVWIQGDRVECVKVSSGLGADDGEYEFTPNPSAAIRVCTLRKDGSYRFVGHGSRSRSTVFFGIRRYYQDPSF